MNYLRKYSECEQSEQLVRDGEQRHQTLCVYQLNDKQCHKLAYGYKMESVFNTSDEKTLHDLLRIQ